MEQLATVVVKPALEQGLLKISVLVNATSATFTLAHVMSDCYILKMIIFRCCSKKLDIKWDIIGLRGGIALKNAFFRCMGKSF